MHLFVDQDATNTPAYQILAEAWLGLVTDQCTPSNDGVPPVAEDSQIVYVKLENEIRGVAASHDHDGVLVLDMLYVEPSSRGLGLGSNMVAKVLDSRAGIQASEAVVYVPKSRKDLKRFFLGIESKAHRKIKVEVYGR